MITDKFLTMLYPRNSGIPLDVLFYLKGIPKSKESTFEKFNLDTHNEIDQSKWIRWIHKLKSVGMIKGEYINGEYFYRTNPDGFNQTIMELKRDFNRRFQ